MYYEGVYRVFRTRNCSDTQFWSCTLSFDGLEVTATAPTRRRAVRRACKNMGRAQALRREIRSVKGLCDGD